MSGYKRNDNMPMTVNDLLGVLSQIKSKPPKVYQKIIDKPIRMSSEEEGNETGRLWSVVVSRGEITLWPA
jgi:hypothetical protein